MTAPGESAIVVRKARPLDVASITRCVCAADLRHIERIGKPPWPMLQDYSTVIRDSQVHVAERHGRVVGVRSTHATGMFCSTGRPCTVTRVC